MPQTANLDPLLIRIIHQQIGNLAKDKTLEAVIAGKEEKEGHR